MLILINVRLDGSFLLVTHLVQTTSFTSQSLALRVINVSSECELLLKSSLSAGSDKATTIRGIDCEALCMRHPG